MYNVWDWFGHLLVQSTRSDERKSSWAARLVLALTALFAVHSLVLYQGCLLTQLTKEVSFI